jgi:hypothetical protein
VNIFVSIASYRDPVLWETVADCMRQAADPKPITIAVVDQSDAAVAPADLPFGDQVRYIHLDHRYSRGPCWARSLALTLYGGEQHVLQIDSHTVFDAGWDVKLVDELAQLKRLSAKPVISTYPCPFERGPDGPIKRPSPGHALVLQPRRDAAMSDDNPGFGFEANPVKTTLPLAGYHLGGGCIFSYGRFFLEVPYDPAVYFQGEEQSLAVRAWTRGWDIFHLPDVPIYHLYAASGERAVHWNADDDAQRQLRWWQLDQASKARLRALLYEGAPLGVFGLGQTRTLQDFSDFSGIDYRTRTITRRPALAPLVGTGSQI